MKKLLAVLLALVLCFSVSACGGAVEEPDANVIYFEEPFHDDGFDYEFMNFTFFDSDMLGVGVEATCTGEASSPNFVARATLFGPSGQAIPNHTSYVPTNEPGEFNAGQLREGASYAYWAPFIYAAEDGTYELVYDAWDKDEDMTFTFVIEDGGNTVKLPLKEGTATFTKADDGSWNRTDN